MAVLRPSLRWKIVLPAILASVATVLFFAHYTMNEVSRVLEEREVAQLRTIADMLARDRGTLNALASQDGGNVHSGIEHILGQTRSIYRIELFIDDDGNGPVSVLVRGPVGEALLPTWGDLAAEGVRAWELDNASGFIIATPVFAEPRVAAGDEDPAVAAPETRRLGTLLIWAGREPIVAAIENYARSILPVGLGLLFAAMTLAVFVTTSMLRHLRDLSRAAVQLGQGSRNVKIPVHGTDEIATLARSFNGMSEKLEISIRRIEEQNRTLEQKVQARTRELLRAYEELQTLDRAKDSFLSSVSHELRTPLTSIRSFSEILLDYGDQEEPELRREFLTIIKDESERLSRLINQVLDLAKIEAGVMTWEIASFDFRDLIQTTVRALAGLKHDKPVEFVLDMPDQAVSYIGDRDRLHQVLTNLVTNAWKFSPRDGEIVIKLRSVEGGIECRVADHGPGIPDDDEKQRIFDRFRQGEHSLTDKPEGTGLGLPISKEIVVMHGGFIACDDNDGGGAVFLFLLPEPDPQYPRPIDEAVADEAGIWADVNDPRRSSIFDSSWVWAARATTSAGPAD